METVRSSFSLKAGPVLRKVIKNVGPENMRKKLPKSFINDENFILPVLFILYLFPIFFLIS